MKSQSARGGSSKPRSLYKKLPNRITKKQRGK